MSTAVFEGLTYSVESTIEEPVINSCNEAEPNLQEGGRRDKNTQTHTNRQNHKWSKMRNMLKYFALTAREKKSEKAVF